MEQLSFLGKAERTSLVNVASVPQRSVFRYPGGKTWLIPYFRKWMRSLPTRPKLFIEPFCGGGSIGLAAAAENMADKVILSEADPHVAAVWSVLISGDVKSLINRILNYPMCRDRVIEDLEKTPDSDVEKAFQVILRNRVQRGGILAPGASLMKSGENGKGIASRWYPETLAKRIKAIAQYRDRMEFFQEDAFRVMRKYLHRKQAAFFLDPPYTAGGKSAGSRLYGRNQIDHALLFQLTAKAKGHALLTYDDSAEVRALVEKHGFDLQEVPMKSTHHAEMLELAITKRPVSALRGAAKAIDSSPAD